jgi:hypothetical protein
MNGKKILVLYPRLRFPFALLVLTLVASCGRFAIAFSSSKRIFVKLRTARDADWECNPTSGVPCDTRLQHGEVS